jgi:hypothetical protein
MPDSQAMVANGSTLLRRNDADNGWDEIAEVSDIVPGAPQAPVVDVSHLKSAAREKRGGLPDTGTMTVTMNLVKGNTIQEAMEETEAGSNTPRKYRIMFPTYASEVSHEGGREYTLILTAFGLTGFVVDGKIQAIATFEVSGKPTIVDPTP